MSLFASILEKLGLKKPGKPLSEVGQAKAAPAGPAAARPGLFGQKSAMPMVDVVAQLDGLSKKWNGKLNWRMSIVDLLKLLELDASPAAIKELAVELKCPDFEMADSARRNIWLHKTILQKISENGGNIPSELLK